MLNSSAVESTATDGVFVGIDWGNAHHQMCVFDTTGQVIAQAQTTHDVAGLGKNRSAAERHGTVAGIAIERSEGLLEERL